MSQFGRNDYYHWKIICIDVPLSLVIREKREKLRYRGSLNSIINSRYKKESYRFALIFRLTFLCVCCFSVPDFSSFSLDSNYRSLCSLNKRKKRKNELNNRQQMMLTTTTMIVNQCGEGSDMLRRNVSLRMKSNLVFVSMDNNPFFMSTWFELMATRESIHRNYRTIVTLNDGNERQSLRTFFPT